ncbi:MAG: Crp/Fnr family transcriptional regulator [Clostridia bacterium]|nr:Crp/Fnr family transcriptional regulator [Clostridia bacterium]
MKKYIEILKKTKLFVGIGDGDIEAMLSCLGATVRSFKKGEYVFHEGEKIQFITVLLEGCILVQRDDYWGNRSIINRIGVGEMFGEAYATPGSGELLNDVVAIEESTVMFFDVLRILTVCPSACRFHSLTVQNLVCAISEKNRSLVAKLGYMSNRSTRGKLLAYLSDEAKKQHSSSFEIPFNRQQLADFLYVDRSAMSNELCKMRDEGILKFEKNKFTLT